MKLPRAGRRIRWLIKGPLGCLSFVAGAAAVTVVLLPFACGRGVARSIEQQFGRGHAGELELGRVHMPAVLGRQRVRSLSLRDPDGHEVLRGSLELPSLRELASHDENDALSACDLDFSSVRLVLHDDGTTNLSRALAPRVGGHPLLGLRSERGRLRLALGQAYDVTLGRSELLVAELHVGLLSLSRHGSAGPPLVVRDLRGRPTLAPEGGAAGLSVLLEGELSSASVSPPASSGVAVFLLTVSDLTAFLAGDPTADLRSAWRLEGAEARVIDGLLGCGDLLARTCGAEPVDVHVERSRRPEGERLALKLDAAAGALALTATRDADGLRAEEKDTLQLSFPAASAWAAEVFGERGLVPWIAACTPDDPAQRTLLVARDFTWGPVPGPGRLRGTLQIDPGAAEVELAPALRGLRPELAGPLRLGADTVLRVQLREDAVRIEATFAQGPAVLCVTGTHVPASGALDLAFRWSGAELGNGARELRVAGTLEHPVAAPAAPRD